LKSSITNQIATIESEKENLSINANEQQVLTRALNNFSYNQEIPDLKRGSRNLSREDIKTVFDQLCPSPTRKATREDLETSDILGNYLPIRREEIEIPSSPELPTTPSYMDIEGEKEVIPIGDEEDFIVRNRSYSVDDYLVALRREIDEESNDVCK